MLEDFKTQLVDSLRIFVKFLWRNTIGQIALVVGIVTFLQALGVWTLIFSWFVRTFSTLIQFVGSLYFGIPVYYWILVSFVLIALSIASIRQYLYLRVVSGAFFDNFKKGLYKWEFGGDHWKIEEEDGKPVLSVSESYDGGITKKGFSWSDYEFTFDTKVISECSGWIIRAENRNKYFMIQLNLTKPLEPRLRPHLRLDVPDYPWIALEGYAVDINNLNLKKPIRLLEWMKVKIIVRSNVIDLFLNGDHVMHFFLPDPFRLEKEKEIYDAENKQVKLKREVVIVSYPVGRVGFRCAGPGEHAHFRDVRVKPLLW